jgi:hypothetical protein
MDVHSTFGPAKTAAILKLVDDEVVRMGQGKEELFAQLVPGRFFQRILRKTFERHYGQTEVHKQLQELETRRLQFAALFCAFGMTREQREELGVDIDFVTVMKAPRHIDDETVRRQVAEHLPGIMAIAREVDREKNP